MRDMLFYQDYRKIFSRVVAWYSLLDDAAEKNLMIVSGDCGRIVVKEFGSMLESYRSLQWREVRLDRAERFASAEMLVVTYVESWYRLVVQYGQPKYMLSNVGKCKHFGEMTDHLEAWERKIDEFVVMGVRG